MPEHSEKHTEENDGLQQLIKCGTEMLGSGTGAAVGAGLGLIAGPSGAILGAVLGKGVESALRKLGQDIWERHLSPREKQRLGTVLGVTVVEINRRREAGESVRTDGLFDDKGSGRSDATEIAESVLLKAQREPEEQKITYMGYMFSSVAFDPGISIHMAHQLAKIAEQLTYHQLCILKLSVVKDKYSLRDRDYRDYDDFGKDLYQILYECAELYDKEYINFGGEANFHIGEYLDFGATLHRLTRAIPARMTLQGIGVDLYNLMKLSLIPDEDITPIAVQLK